MCPWARCLKPATVEYTLRPLPSATGQLWGRMCWYSRNVSRVLSGNRACDYCSVKSQSDRCCATWILSKYIILIICIVDHHLQLVSFYILGIFKGLHIPIPPTITIWSNVSGVYLYYCTGLMWVSYYWFVLLEVEPLAQLEVLSSSGPGLVKGLLCTLLRSAFTRPCPVSQSLPPQHGAASTMLHRGDQFFWFHQTGESRFMCLSLRRSCLAITARSVECSTYGCPSSSSLIYTKDRWSSAKVIFTPNISTNGCYLEGFNRSRGHLCDKIFPLKIMYLYLYIYFFPPHIVYEAIGLF